MKPLKITAKLSSPIAGEVPMLDAILERQMFRVAGSIFDSSGGGKHLTRTNARSDLAVTPGAMPIPIDRSRVSGFPWPIPRCSSPIFVAADDRSDHYARRMELTDPGLLADDERKVFQAGGGEFKSYRLPLRARLVDRVVWFAMGRGRKYAGGHKGGGSEVRKLLRQVTHIGKKTSQGYGRVSEWTVEIVEDDWSWYAPSPGGTVLMRPLPAAMGMPTDVVGARPWYGGVVGPYWDSQFFVEAVIPC